MGASGNVARITLPATHELSPVHDLLRDTLVAMCGGYTTYGGFGAWKDGAKPVEVEQALTYEILIPVASHTARFSRAFEKVRDVLKILYTHEAMQEDAVYFVVNSTANVLSREEIVGTPTPEAPRKVAVLENPRPLVGFAGLKRGDVLAYHGGENHGPSTPEALGKATVLSNTGLGIEVEWPPEECNVGKGCKSGHFGASPSDRRVWSYVGKGEVSTDKTARLTRISALETELASLKAKG